MPDPPAGPEVRWWQLAAVAFMSFTGLLTSYTALLGRPDFELVAIGLFMAIAGVLLFVTQYRRYRIQNPKQRRGSTL